MSSETDCISISESTFTIKSIPNTNASSLSRATSAAAVRVPFPHSSNYQNSPKTPFVHNNHHQNINVNVNLHRNHFSQQIYNISNKLNCQIPLPPKKYLRYHGLHTLNRYMMIYRLLHPLTLNYCR